jgi:hypothetical protein
MLLVLAAAVALARYTDLMNGRLVMGVCVGLMVLLGGVGLIVLGIWGRKAGGFVAAALALALLAAPLATGADALRWTDAPIRTGNTFVRPDNPEAAAAGYSLTVGQLEVDLTDPALLDGEDLDVAITTGVGTATVVLPARGAVVVTASLAVGEIAVDGLDSDRWQIDFPSSVTLGLRSWASGGLNWLSEADRDAGVDGIGVGFSAHTKSAEAPDGPVLRVDLRGSIGELRIVEEN